MEVDKIMNKEDVDDDVLLPGFRFHPTDEELVGFYLRRKVEKKPLSIELIKVVDIYKLDPWDLPITSAGDKEMYFFCIRERKYKNSIRPNRVTGSGFWKATGIDRPIYSSAVTNDCIGLKKSLVYYRGSAGKGTKTDWMMHEFRLPTNAKSTNCALPSPKNNTQEAEIWTLCRIFKRNVSYKKYIPGWRDSSSSRQNPSDSSSQTCSIESVNRDKSTVSSFVQQKVSKPFCNQVEVSHIAEKFPLQFGSITPAPLYSNNISFSNGFVRDQNWDELGAMLEFASNSSFLYGCK